MSSTLQLTGRSSLASLKAGIIARLPAQMRQDIESKCLLFSERRLRDFAADGWDESLITGVRVHGSLISVQFEDPSSRDFISLSLTLNQAR